MIIILLTDQQYLFKKFQTTTKLVESIDGVGVKCLGRGLLSTINPLAGASGATSSLVWAIHWIDGCYFEMRRVNDGPGTKGQLFDLSLLHPPQAP